MAEPAHAACWKSLLSVWTLVHLHINRSVCGKDNSLSHTLTHLGEQCTTYHWVHGHFKGFFSPENGQDRSEERQFQEASHSWWKRGYICVKQRTSLFSQELDEFWFWLRNGRKSYEGKNCGLITKQRRVRNEWMNDVIRECVCFTFIHLCLSQRMGQREQKEIKEKCFECVCVHGNVPTSWTSPPAPCWPRHLRPSDESASDRGNQQHKMVTWHNKLSWSWFSGLKLKEMNL